MVTAAGVEPKLVATATRVCSGLPNVCRISFFQCITHHQPTKRTRVLSICFWILPFNRCDSTFETNWKPKSWDTDYRFIFTRRKTRKQHKAPFQLDLFEPRDFNYNSKAIVTNKGESAKTVILGPG
jgi:hypothetical protein